MLQVSSGGNLHGVLAVWPVTSTDAGCVAGDEHRGRHRGGMQPVKPGVLQQTRGSQTEA